MTALWPKWYRVPSPIYGIAERTLLRAAVAAGLSESQLRGESRSRHVVYPRFAVMVALDRNGWSSVRIGRALGDRDHSTILSGLKRAKVLIETDADFALLVDLVAA